ncbi:aspartate ammonia-lyase [Elizabethkingia meningoseptica]|uniref:aspartate ammonia-lyase n=1 Tax=Elizabethkingia meningoseptica TaxID=238 RepID=UPI000332D51A|nr:aspartate ammonia-lyase [Elizabethkingia meningoseptica]AQX06580.1 aspartate ammonia-lyase [Elizabethkingia meningoseptica]AQX48627.1 class II fumarate hydratase [Elizabethkingia meningoseptica]EOR29382.1 aspartate ammonia-lyase [Elizabethkingia meningoseptica ATCC 13253 = NBRC 12535]KUY13681.1 class II fumarate hydratase [Elizabethkingia meningoseptica]MDE5466606.1 aspartate ammonia-lyase [Elizabethkingia meningoseptica]
MTDYRIESDLIGELKVPADAYYGVQTQRAIDNFKISNDHLSDHPEFIKAFAFVKKAAAQTNFELGLLDEIINKNIAIACDEIVEGKMHDQFPTDMIQGGAGTSMNMNANEVIANRALELMGHQKGEYQFCSPNDHVNLSQSTNDAYPTAIRIALYNLNKTLVERLELLILSFRKKAEDLKDVIKMGRTQLQDAVPMTMGQEFNAFANTLQEEIARLNTNADLFLETNMGATAIGTGLNAHPDYAKKCTENLAKVSGTDVVLASDLVEATPDTGAYVIYSSAMKRMAVKLSKICNDLRLLASGPRAGFFEINLPKMQPGSSIMPGKVNPVIPEVVNQVCFKVIGNDLTVTFAAEAGQLQLNVMEPVLTQSIMESIRFLKNAMDTLREKCIDGITANKEVCLNMVKNSIGIVTALNPYIGYKNSTKIAKEALDTGKSVYDLVLEHELLSKERLDEILAPENMLNPHAKF